MLLALLLTFAAPASEPMTQEELTIDLLRRAAEAAERSAEAAERAARAAEVAAEGARHEEGEPAPAAAPPAKPPMFTGVAGFSLTAINGNSNSIMGSLNVGLNFLLGPYTIGVKALGAYGRARSATTEEFSDTALNVSTELKLARSFGKLMGVYIIGGYGMDHIAKIDWRAYGEAGAQITFFKKVEGDLIKLQLVTDLGLRYQRESWYQFYATPEQPVGGLTNPQPNQLFIKVAGDFRYAINKNVIFSERLELLPDVLTAANFNMISATNLGVKLIGPLSLTASFTLKFDNLPPPGAQKLDTILSLGADVTF